MSVDSCSLSLSLSPLSSSHTAGVVCTTRTFIKFNKNFEVHSSHFTKRNKIEEEEVYNY